MSTHTLTDARVYMDGVDLSADGNELNIVRQPTTHDFTTFTNGTRIFKSGMFAGSYMYRGFQQEGTGLVGDVLRQKFATANIPILASAEGGNAGDRCAFFRALSNQYKPISGTIGEPFLFEISGQPDGGFPIAEGTILEDGKTARTTTGTGTILNVGAVGSTQRLYAIVHVLAIDAGNVVVTIESAAVSGFGSPTTRVTFAAKTTFGGEFIVPIVGPITDAYWRAKWTLAGGATSIRAVGAIAIF